MKIPLFRPFFPDECRRRIAMDLDRVLENGQLMLGEYKNKFEKLFSETIGVLYSISVNSCTTALTICLKYFDVMEHEVLVPSGAFITSISSIIFAGGKPVLVDMNPSTLSFDLEDLRRKVTPRTKGMIWVHLAGFVSPEYEKILDFAREKNLFLIEDSAHALGSVVDGKFAGSLGDAGCFSFYPTKVITCGTGGMITTKNEELKAYAERIRVFGKAPGMEAITELGNDWFLDEVRACVGYNQLLDLASNLRVRREIADRYRTLLDGQSGMALFRVSEKMTPSYYQFPVFLDGGVDRQKLIRKLKEKHGIETKGIYRPCHREEVFTPFDDGSLRKTEETLERSLCLPIFVNMSEEDVEFVATCLIKELSAAL